MDSVRFVIIGAGGMGRQHIHQLKSVPEAEIAALVDPSAQAIALSRDAFPDLAGVPAFDDYRAALSSVTADAAVIVSPHNEHLEHGLACLDAGLHVLMEKPFVPGSANAERLIARARERGRHVGVAYQRHLEGAYIYLRQLVRDGALGTLRFVSAYQAQAWLTGTTGTWRQDPERSRGGQLNDSGSHLLDVVLWTTGLQPVQVYAQIDNRGTRVDVDSALTVHFQGGAIATFSIIGSASVNWWEDMSVHGDRGSALYRNGRLLIHHLGEAAPIEVAQEDLPPSSDPDRDFVQTVLGRVAEPAAPASCGLAVSRLTEAAWESARIGQPVALVVSG